MVLPLVVLSWHCVAQSPLFSASYQWKKFFKTAVKKRVKTLGSNKIFTSDLHGPFSILHLCMSSLQSKSTDGFFTSQLEISLPNNIMPSTSHHWFDSLLPVLDLVADNASWIASRVANRDHEVLLITLKPDWENAIPPYTYRAWKKFTSRHSGQLK